MSIENAAPVESPSSASGLTSSAGPVGAAGAKNSTLSSGARNSSRSCGSSSGSSSSGPRSTRPSGWGTRPAAKRPGSTAIPRPSFLGSIDQGPFASLFNNMAGNVVVDVLFILGMFAIGVAVIAGVAMKISAVSGSLIMAMMWLAEWPMAQTTGAGEPTGSTNPFMDYHIAYALVLFALVAVAAGKTWGLGNVWEKLPVVSSQKWMH